MTQNVLIVQHNTMHYLRVSHWFHAWIVRLCLSVRNVSVGLKCVRITKIESWLSLSPLKTVVSRKVISVLEISALNLMVG